MKPTNILPLTLVVSSLFAVTACTTTTTQTTSASETASMAKSALTNEQKAVALLESLETGDMTPVSYINPNKYIQHNLMVGDGLAGFGEVMKHKPPQGFKAKVIRSFQDGDYVFTHTQYDFFGEKVGFDIFRFEDGLIVEHWDNLAKIAPPNLSGHTQLDGATEVTDLDKTDSNKAIVNGLINDVFIGKQMQKLPTYINPNQYINHNPMVADGLTGLKNIMKQMQEKGIAVKIKKVHKILGQGNFVLAVSEGEFNGKVAFYDLFRLENGQIVEHWDVIEPILPKSQWKNSNGKFGF